MPSPWTGQIHPFGKPLSIQWCLFRGLQNISRSESATLSAPRLYTTLKMSIFEITHRTVFVEDTLDSQYNNV